MNNLKQFGYKFVLAKGFTKGTNNEKLCAITFDDGYKSVKQINDFMLKTKTPYSIFITSGFIEKQMDSFLLEWEIKELASTGSVEIGSHSVTHCDLKSLEKSDLNNELQQSKEYLSRISGQEIESFAYPFGSFDLRIINEVKKNYSYAYSVYSSVISDFRYSIPRLDLNRTNIKHFLVLLKDVWKYRSAVY